MVLGVGFTDQRFFLAFSPYLDKMFTENREITFISRQPFF
jgi:hypothetical protein